MNFYNNNYISYWKDKVNDNSSTAPKDDIFVPILKSYLRSASKVLDIGCCWGRHFETIANIGCNLFAIDISTDMVIEAKLNASRLGLNPDNILLGNAEETLPFNDSTFDVIYCFGVFDCLNQCKSLSEISRVLKPGGICMLTGKNNFYCNDDSEAKLAELGARSKGEPNFFTDINLLVETLVDADSEILEFRSYVRRGDFAANKFIPKKIDVFYEFFISFSNSDSLKIQQFSDSIFSPYSLIN